MRRIFLISFLFFSILFAQENIQHLDQKLDELHKNLSYNTWVVKYNNFNIYKKTQDEILSLEKESLKANERNKNIIERQILILKERLGLLSEYKSTNFTKMVLAPEEVEKMEKITNPLAIVSAYSHIKKLRRDKEEYINLLNSFKQTLQELEKENVLITEIAKIDPTKEHDEHLRNSNQMVKDFAQTLRFGEISYSVYEKKIQEEIEKTTASIKIQGVRAFNIVLAIVIVIAMAFLLKFIARKYIGDNDRFYTANKIINFININVIVLILLFGYIENISYLVTVLGFASAGLAIAMKDMFMSMLGWCVIVFGGSFRVGDRVKVFQNNTHYIGDIIDISFLRITLYEDISLLTYTDNRRAGRIIFIPNNFIFTNLISNYTHHGMKTIWDGLDITLTFDSNHQKALEIVEEIVVKASKGYTKIAKESMNKLRNEYSIRNPKVEPRFFTFLEGYGIRISVWYMTNSYAALVLRSNISKEIINEFNKHDDIKIAYPSQNLYMAKHEIIKNKEDI
ncbi:mechanosensitive ion channel MscS [Campylobacter lari]|uniref:Mechanosensitive ion channel family protein n=1 Tax=Campylobacter lari NCTC 11845 TaxID=1388749 RepID=A0A0A8HV03_CAMLA|nr:mechanosensitive ion channel family protein [Campylobacter lari]AJD01652.1 mechanosensitive ion channel family protein [Campylobacter lari NCTC 11845]EAK0847355.1 mechanosensitive ion channel family protein [Campylobacter lari]EAK0980242.1 mechanosensitive ion channel family protein [Campylobacter lari]EAK9954422.1 mechanosensitive ion channel family protein [Campylobacter lari]MCR6542358.1 mechanosensitive ion channel family protein [Campylobacter lari]